MARKSNKTAHVLNLLSGNDTKKEDAEEKEQASHSPETHNGSQAVSVIDTTESDPVADMIQNSLMSELESMAPAPAAPKQDTPAAVPEPEPTIAAPVPEPEPTVSIQEAPDAVSEPKPTVAAPVPESEPTVSKQEASDAVSEPAASAAASTPEPTATAPVPEPDFITINVMESIVRDKIIYFMRQFDVCTCDRCIADTVALTLNGLAPKYIVTSPAAAAPLLSYYTNKYISDVTVEATKACMIIGENPRH